MDYIGILLKTLEIQVNNNSSRFLNIFQQLAIIFSNDFMKYFPLAGRSEAVVDRCSGLRAGGRLEVEQQRPTCGGFRLDEEQSPTLQRSQIRELHEDQSGTLSLVEIRRDTVR